MNLMLKFFQKKKTEYGDLWDKFNVLKVQNASFTKACTSCEPIINFETKKLK